MKVMQFSQGNSLSPGHNTIRNKLASFYSFIAARVTIYTIDSAEKKAKVWS